MADLLSKFWFQCIAVTVVMTLVDFCYAEYTKTTAGGRAIPASLWASVIILLTSFVTTSYVHDGRLIGPAVVGSFIGTWLSVRRTRHGSSSEQS